MWQLNRLRGVAVFVVAAVVSVTGCHSAAHHATSPVLTVADLPSGWSSWPVLTNGVMFSTTDNCGAGDISDSTTLGGTETKVAFVNSVAVPPTSPDRPFMIVK